MNPPEESDESEPQSIHAPKNLGRLTVQSSTGKLFWDNRELVARTPIDFNVKTSWKIFAAVVAAAAGLGSTFGAFISFNKEMCWWKIGSCNVSTQYVDNAALAAIAIAVSGVGTRLEALAENTKPPLEIDNSALPKIATATKAIASSIGDIAKKLEKPEVLPPLPSPLSKVYFPFGSDKPTDDTDRAIDDWARFLKAHPKARIEVRGYTDSNGTLDENMKTSMKRANYVVDQLLKRGVARMQLIPRGLGAEDPISGNDTDEGRAKNRRVEFVYLQ